MVSTGLRDDGKRGRRRNVQGRTPRGYKVRKPSLACRYFGSILLLVQISFSFVSIWLSYITILYLKTKENTNWTKDKMKPQHKPTLYFKSGSGGNGIKRKKLLKKLYYNLLLNGLFIFVVHVCTCTCTIIVLNCLFVV